MVDVAININGVIGKLSYNGQNIFSATNTIFLGLYIDHPAYHISCLSDNIKNHLVCFIDKEHVEYANGILPNHHKISFFLPHGGLKSKNCKTIGSLDEYKKQKIVDIVFSGTFNSHIEKSWHKQDSFPKYIPAILDEVSDKLIFDDKAVLHKTFYDVCSKYGIRFSTISKVQLSNMLIELIKYVRSFKRFELIKNIVKSGLNITICGKGWENFAKEHKNVNYLGSLNIDENLELISKAKVLINVTPNFNNGSHERVFTGMLNNSVIFSDKSSYYDEFFEDEKNILYYSFNSLAKDIEKLKNLINDDEKLFAMSKSAYEIANKHHTWDNRVEKIVEMVNLSKLMDT